MIVQSEALAKLIDELEKILTKNEEQRQMIVQTVSAYRKQFKNVSKKNLWP